jgi:hypothetical protein
MLDQQQQVVAKDTANSRAGRRALQLQRGAVRHGAKVDDRQFHGTKDCWLLIADCSRLDQACWLAGC